MTWGELRRLTAVLPDDQEVYLWLDHPLFDEAFDSVEITNIDLEQDTDGSWSHSVDLVLHCPGLIEMIRARERAESAVFQLEAAIRELKRIIPGSDE